MGCSSALLRKLPSSYPTCLLLAGCPMQHLTLPCARAARRPEARRFGIQFSLILNRERRPVASGRRLLARAMAFLPSRVARQCLARLSTSAEMSYFYIEGIQSRGTGWRVVSVCHGASKPWRCLVQRVLAASPCVNARKTSRLPRNQPDSRYTYASLYMQSTQISFKIRQVP